MESAQERPRLVELEFRPLQPELDKAESIPDESKEIGREYLANKLNYLNFQGVFVQVNFKHATYDHTVSVPAKPLPCLGDTLDCAWVEPEGMDRKIKSYRFHTVHVPDGQKLLIVKSDAVRVHDKGIRIRLPEICREFRCRKKMRHACTGIGVQLIQNSVTFKGKLIDFGGNSFRVEVSAGPPQTFQWIYPESTVIILLSREQETLYSGECRIIRQTLGQKTRTFVLEPLTDSIQRFQPREYRSGRYRLLPSPSLIFHHPFTGKRVHLTVVELSGSGLSVEEDENTALLLPGMMIPFMELSFANSFKMNCRGQVINRNGGRNEENGTQSICGLVFLDMDPEDHSKLLGILNQAKNRNTYISNAVDPDALWNFFFETGFIYPQKYAFVETNKAKIKAVYEKLYTQSPSIGRHFVYQDNGRILGHVAMLRYFGNSWLIHHHAANTSVHNRAGLVVLSQIHHYFNDTYKIFSAHLDLVFCYFRPQNKFPMRVFGGSARHMKDPKGCSLDTFAYFHHRKTFSNALDMPEPWTLTETRPEDLAELETFYTHVSGGLMLNAFGLEPDVIGTDEVAGEYRRLGFKKERRLYSLNKADRLRAVAVVNRSDIGLNLSDLINCIHVVVVDPDIPKDILNLALSMLSTPFETDEMPVLIYPVSYADDKAIAYEKLYTLWVLNMQSLDPYFRFIQRLLRSV